MGRNPPFTVLNRPPSNSPLPSQCDAGHRAACKCDGDFVGNPPTTRQSLGKWINKPVSQGPSKEVSPGIGYWMFLGSEKVGFTWTYPGQSSWSLGSFHLRNNLKVCQVDLMEKIPNLQQNTTHHTYQPVEISFDQRRSQKVGSNSWPRSAAKKIHSILPKKSRQNAESSAQQLSPPNQGKKTCHPFKASRKSERERPRTNEDLVML